MKVLLVDDSITVRMIIRKLLGDMDITAIEEAGSGQAALEAATNTFFDLILLDIRMPEMSGLEFLEALHRNPHAASHGCPSIIISSEPDTQQIAAAKFLGACDHIKKPFTEDHLRRALARVGRKEPAKQRSDSSVTKSESYISGITTTTLRIQKAEAKTNSEATGEEDQTHCRQCRSPVAGQ